MTLVHDIKYFVMCHKLSSTIVALFDSYQSTDIIVAFGKDHWKLGSTCPLIVRYLPSKDHWKLGSTCPLIVRYLPSKNRPFQTGWSVFFNFSKRCFLSRQILYASLSEFFSDLCLWCYCSISPRVWRDIFKNLNNSYKIPGAII